MPYPAPVGSPEALMPVDPPADTDERTPLLMSRASRRRIGAALVAYGIVGTILAVLVAAAGIFGAFRLDDALARIEAERAELAATVAAAADALARVSATFEASRPGLDRLTSMTGQLSTVAGDIGLAADDLASRMDVSVLGFQPFAGLGDRMSGIGDQMQSVASDLQGIGPAVSAVADGTAGISASLVTLQARLDAVAARIDALGPFDETGRILAVGLLLVVLLDLWLAIPALTAIVVGRRLRRG
jgi:methyl-accepting chemotaxis protein